MLLQYIYSLPKPSGKDVDHILHPTVVTFVSLTLFALEMSLFSVSFLLVPYVSLLLCPFVEGALLNKKEYLQDAVDGLSVSVPGDSSPLSSSPAELPASVASFPPPPESNSWAVVVSSSPPPPPPPRLSDPWAIATSSTPPPPLSSDGAILPSEPSPTSPELRPSVDVGEPSGPTAVVQSPASLITPPPTVPGTLSTALSSDQAGCIPWPQCNIFFQVSRFSSVK